MIQKPIVIRRKITIKTLDCKSFLLSRTEIYNFLTFFVVVPRRGHLGIAAFQHILQDRRTQNIPLILVTPGLKQPKEVWGKEIAALQALSSISPVIKSEDLQSLIHEIMSAVEGAKT